MARYGWQLLVPSFCVCGTYYLYTQIANFWKSRNIATHVSVPFLGKLCELLSFGTCDVFYKYYSRDKYVGVMYTTKPVVLMRDPDLVYRMLKDEHFDSRGNKINKTDFMSKSILFVEDQLWEKLHEKLEVIFGKESIPKYFYLINLSVENFIVQLEKKSDETIDIHELLQKLYQDIVMILCIGDFTKIQSQKVDINKRFNCLYSSKFEKNVFFGTVYPSWFSLSRTNLLSKTGEYFRKIVRDVIEFRDNNDYTREDMLQSFLNARDSLRAHAQLEGDFVFDNDAVIAQSLTMLLMGKDMMANTTAFCLYELAQHTDMQTRLGKELSEVMEEHSGLNVKALLEMDYLKQVVAESLRKYPVVPAFTRTCTKSYTDPDSQLKLQPGDIIVVPVHCIQNDPNYFPHPHQFKPQRFDEKNEIKAGTYLPFGKGAKECIAQELAIMQVFLVLSRVLAKFEVMPSKKLLKFNSSSFLTAPKNGVWLQFNKKEKPILSP